MWRFWILLGFVLAATAYSQPKRVLYVTHSAGFRHDSIPASIQVLREISSSIEIVATEDVAMLTAEALRNFDAVLFFTSGELPLQDSQKRGLMEFVRSGKGFAGVHSATDTLYNWPEYGELIGARFNGHPWVQQVTLDVEDPAHPAVAHLAPGFSIHDEIYQFRDFSRGHARVLLTLDPHSVSLAAPGVNPGTEDFPLAWCRNFGAGRVFYTALGHFESTWRDPRFMKMLAEALRWVTGQVEADAAPRAPSRPSFAPGGIANSASFRPAMTISPGTLFTIFGAGLTPGGASSGDLRQPSYKLAGTVLKVNGVTVPLVYASPGQVNAFAPLDLRPRECSAGTDCTAPYFDLSLSTSSTSTVRLHAAPATPGVFAVTASREWVTVWATGMGAVLPQNGLHVTAFQPTVDIGGAPAAILFSGLAPGWLGLYQVNVAVPPGTAWPAMLTFRFGDYQQTVEVKLQ